MFNGSRFFHLLRKWKKTTITPSVTIILKDVMNHYYDSLAGTADSSKLIIHRGAHLGKHSICYVLDAVGYRNYSIEYKHGDAIVTLSNTL